MTNSIARKTITCQLVVLLSAYFMAQFDFFVVNVAAPSFERSRARARSPLSSSSAATRSPTPPA